MTLKRYLWVCYVHFFIFLFKLKKFKHTNHINCSLALAKPEMHIDLITVAFNNEYLIEKQIKLINKFIKDKDFSLIIADNSSRPEKRILIRDICSKYEVGYISIPDNLMIKYAGDGYSHGATLNWIYHNFIKKRKPAIFGFIDHDLFPIVPISIKEKIGIKDFYGPVRDQEKGWYIWAGLCFFKYEIVKDLPLNFIPYMIDGVFLDTGGSNYPILYHKYDKTKVEDLTTRNVNITSESDRSSNYHADFLQFIDECWLHLINGSNWKKIPEKSQQIKERMLDEITQNIEANKH